MFRRSSYPRSLYAASWASVNRQAIVAGRDPGHFRRPDLVPECHVGEMVLDRPAVDRGFGHEAVAETLDGRGQLLPHPPVVLQQFVPVLSHASSSMPPAQPPLATLTGGRANHR